MGVWLMKATTPTIFEIKRIHTLDQITANKLVAALDAMKFERRSADKKGDAIAVQRIDAAILPLKVLINSDKIRKGDR